MRFLESAACVALEVRAEQTRTALGLQCTAVWRRARELVTTLEPREQGSAHAVQRTQILVDRVELENEPLDVSDAVCVERQPEVQEVVRIPLQTRRVVLHTECLDAVVRVPRCGFQVVGQRVTSDEVFIIISFVRDYDFVLVNSILRIPLKAL